MKAIKIKWDTDGDEALFRTLPTALEIPEGMSDVDEISDWLSDEVGFCHEGFELVKEMKIYIIERDNPECRPNPEVYMDGKVAFEKVREEYNSCMQELRTSQDKADSGLGGYGCYWNFMDSDFCGDALIDSDYDSDRWEWRITEHMVTYPA